LSATAISAASVGTQFKPAFFNPNTWVT
jgi:hypothetical protein